MIDDLEIPQLVRTGHFAYESGHHGDTWLTLELLFASPRRLQRSAARLAERLRPHRADFVCGPLVGGAFVGQAVAAALDLDFVYAERQAPAGGPVRYEIPAALRAGRAEKRALIVDDAVNAGSAAVACVEAVRALGAEVVALGSLILRDAAAPELQRRLGVPAFALRVIPWAIWPPAECPPCRSGLPLERA